MRSANTAKARSIAVCLGIGLALGGATAAAAGDPWLAGPSTVTAAEKGVFSGGNFAPGALLTVRVADSLGNEYAQSVMAAADGTLTYELTPSVEGLYTLKVLDANGKPLATAAFGVGR